MIGSPAWTIIASAIGDPSSWAIRPAICSWRSCSFADTAVVRASRSSSVVPLQASNAAIRNMATANVAQLKSLQFATEAGRQAKAFELLKETAKLRATALDLAALVKSKKVSATDAAKSALARLDAVNPKLNAVVDHRPDDVLKQASSVDAAIARGLSTGIELLVREKGDLNTPNVESLLQRIRTVPVRCGTQRLHGARGSRRQGHPRLSVHGAPPPRTTPPTAHRPPPRRRARWRRCPTNTSRAPPPRRASIAATTSGELPDWLTPMATRPAPRGLRR